MKTFLLHHCSFYFVSLCMPSLVFSPLITFVLNQCLIKSRAFLFSLQPFLNRFSFKNLQQNLVLLLMQVQQQNGAMAGQLQELFSQLSGRTLSTARSSVREDWSRPRKQPRAKEFSSVTCARTRVTLAPLWKGMWWLTQDRGLSSAVCVRLHPLAEKT